MGGKLSVWTLPPKTLEDDWLIRVLSVCVLGLSFVFTVLGTSRLSDPGLLPTPHSQELAAFVSAALSAGTCLAPWWLPC